MTDGAHERTRTRRGLLATTLVVTLVLMLALNAAPPLAEADQAVHVPLVSRELHRDVSPPLRDLASKSDLAVGRRTIPVKPLPPRSAPGTKDSAIQTAVARSFVGSVQGLNVPGIGTGAYGFVPDSAPPDTNAAVGATQVVEWVNESFAVFDKATGAIAPGFPKRGNTIWAGFGGGCQTNNDGDPIVQYDKAAERWILSQFSVSTLPYLQCVAVSTTPDASGPYNRYSFSYGNLDFPDYPKLGVWPDAYYISFNIFRGNTFVGPLACAYDRSAMLAGLAATQVCFQESANAGSLLPSDLDGATPPPSGSPNYFLGYGLNDLTLWRFHVDFGNPANSSLSGPIVSPVATFSEACGGGACIPQQGTSQRLDSLGDRLMYRLAYRNFGDHEVLVANHSVAAGGSVGVRWYEIRDPGGAPSVFQQGTYAPDGIYRWMGSIAMDKAGDIALGYSASSASTFPSIRYTGRVPADPIGTLEAENVIINGTGSQTGGLSRWGDYSSISVDPSDDCTFWYANEYLISSGSFNWSTRLASFHFPGCPSGVMTPTVTGVSPNQGPTAGGTSVTIAGTNLTGANAVTFGGAAATTFVVNSATSITATSPAQPAGTVDIKVTTPAGQSATSPADRFTYAQAQAAVTLSSTLVSFGTVEVGTTSAIQLITLTDTGGVDLNITSIAVDNADYNETDNCGRLVPAGTNCQIQLSVSPSAAGPDNGNLVITDDALDSPQQVALTSTGSAPAVALSQTSVDFGTVSTGTTSSPRKVTLTNSGTAPLNIIGIGTDNPDYTESDNCPFSPTTLAPGGVCTLTLTVTPASDAGEGGNVIINTDAPDTPENIAMTVNGGTAPPAPARREPIPTRPTPPPVRRSQAPRPQP